MEQDVIVLRKPRTHVRAGWAAASRALARTGDDKLVWPEFGNEADRVHRVVASDVPSVYKLKITLSDVRPAVWRRIEVLGDTTLPRLHRIIQAAMGWNDSHLHVFTVGATQYGVPDPDLPFTSERRVRLEDIVFAAKQRFTYLYDFGDDWLHNVLVESISAAHVNTIYPRFIDGRNACPPDDVGGPPGYASILEVLENPSHPDYKEMREWVGGRFNPAALDVEGIEMMLRRLVRRS